MAQLVTEGCCSPAIGASRAAFCAFAILDWLATLSALAVGGRRRCASTGRCSRSPSCISVITGLRAAVSRLLQGCADRDRTSRRRSRPAGRDNTSAPTTPRARHARRRRSGVRRRASDWRGSAATKLHRGDACAPRLLAGRRRDGAHDVQPRAISRRTIAGAQVERAMADRLAALPGVRDCRRHHAHSAGGRAADRFHPRGRGRACRAVGRQRERQRHLLPGHGHSVAPRPDVRRTGRARTPRSRRS